MPTQYTTLLGLAKPVTGELPGTWGATVNSYLTDYIDSAVAGAQVISGSQTAVTLSTTNGSSLVQAGVTSSGSSQYAIIRCTGNPAGLLTITAPAASKAYLIINATSTSQSVKLVGAGPTTGVTVAASRAALVAWNGSDFALISSTDIAQLSGTLAVANGGTGATTLTGVLKGNGASPVTASNVNLASEVTGTLPVLNGGTGVTSSTGTGSVVLSTSPTLTTPTLGAASATSVALGAGAVGTPSLTATGDLNTGMWFPAADTLAWSVGGAEGARITSAGRVGIGTISPSTKLEAVDTTDCTVSSTANSGIAAFQTNSSGTNPAYVTFNNAGGQRARIVATNANSLLFTTGPSSVNVAACSNSGNFQFDSGYGSVATAYGCRAWINFNGTTVTNPASTTGIRGSGNVSSVLDNGTGDYTINFTTAMPDTNYAVTGVAKEYDSATGSTVVFYLAEQTVANTLSTSFVRVHTATGGASTATDAVVVCVAIFR